MNKEDYSKYYVQGSDHYLIPKDIFDELFDEMFNWREEAKELSKQLENKYKKIGTLTNEVLYEENTKLIKQQKEFIEYMNKTIEELECDDEDDEVMKGYLIQSRNTFKEILSKYKSIIGNDINVVSKGDK